MKDREVCIVGHFLFTNALNVDGQFNALLHLFFQNKIRHSKDRCLINWCSSLSDEFGFYNLQYLGWEPSPSKIRVLFRGHLCNGIQNESLEKMIMASTKFSCISGKVCSTDRLELLYETQWLRANSRSVFVKRTLMEDSHLQNTLNVLLSPRYTGWLYKIGPTWIFNISLASRSLTPYLWIALALN